jgi:tripartite-type tricarboxylate transporter receptor subunit TctC
MNKRTWLRCATALAVALACGTAAAQGSFPSQTIRLISPAPPVGSTDMLARLLASSMQGSLGGTVIVENKPGAGGNIGAVQVARAAPDGYTVLIGVDTTLTVNPHIYDKLPFKAADLRPVAILASSGMVVGVHPSAGVDSMQALVAAGRSRELLFSSSGPGSPGHLAGAILAHEAGMEIVNVPYKGNAPAVTAVLTGEVQGGGLVAPGLLPHVQAGKVRALAVTGAQRSPLLPQVPTVGELGLKDLELDILYVAMVPAATPEPMVRSLQNAMKEAMSPPEVRERLRMLDMRTEATATETAAQRLANLSSRHGKIARAASMKAE